MSGRAIKTHKFGNYDLQFDMNALADAEAELGKPIKTLMRDPDEFGSPTTFRALIWAGLQEHHECDIREAGRIIQEVGIENCEAAILAALETAFPDAKKKAKAKAKKAKAKT